MDVNPQRGIVAQDWLDSTGHNSFGIEADAFRFTRGSSFLATPGWRAKSLSGFSAAYGGWGSVPKAGTELWEKWPGLPQPDNTSEA